MIYSFCWRAVNKKEIAESGDREGFLTAETFVIDSHFTIHLTDISRDTRDFKNVAEVLFWDFKANETDFNLHTLRRWFSLSQNQTDL